MAGVKALVALAFMGSVGLLFLFLGCALPQYSNWWPFFVVIFYFLAPVPTLIGRRFSDGMGTSSSAKEFCTFLTTGIIISAFALPILLARAHMPSSSDHVIHWGAALLVMTGNAIMFLTILGFFMAFDNDDPFEYSTW